MNDTPTSASNTVMIPLGILMAAFCAGFVAAVMVAPLWLIAICGIIAVASAAAACIAILLGHPAPKIGR